MLRVLAFRQGDRRLVLETSVLENPYGDIYIMNSVDKTNLYCNITTVKNFRINALYTSRLSLGVTLAKLRNIEGVLTVRMT